MTLLKLSASKIKTFIECRNRYYWRYIQHEADPKTIHAILGISFHKAIELYYRYRRDPYQVFDETWTREREAAGLSHDNKLYFDGFDMLEKYPGEDHNPQPSLQERFFTLDFPNKEAPICVINGVIDQVYETEEMVWDLKTSKRKPTVKQLNNDPQFIIYAWACNQLFGYVPKIVWYHARTGEQLVADVHGEEKLQTVIDTVHSIIAFHENPQPEVVTKTCFFCPYVALCRGEGTVDVSVH